MGLKLAHSGIAFLNYVVRCYCEVHNGFITAFPPMAIRVLACCVSINYDTSYVQEVPRCMTRLLELWDRSSRDAVRECRKVIS